MYGQSSYGVGTWLHGLKLEVQKPFRRTLVGRGDGGLNLGTSK